MKHERDVRDTIDVVWCVPHPTHYNTFLFDRLARVRGANLRVVYYFDKLALYPWKSSFPTTISESHLRRRLGVDWRFVLQRIRARDELLVVAGWNEPTMLLLLVWFSLTGRPFMLWTDTPNLRDRPGYRQWLRKQYLSLIFRNVHRYLVTGRPGVENARAMGVPPDRIVNFPFATDTTIFAPATDASARPASTSPVFISSGRLDHGHKAYDLAVEAFALVKARDPSLRFRYVIAGDGPDRGSLEGLIEERGLADDVDLKGWLEPRDLPAFYRSGDVFLHPSNFDPFPNAVLEAMSSGLPVIGSEAAGSVKDRVVEGDNGYLHRPGNVEELYEKIVRMIRLTHETRRAMGERARETALRWSVEYNAGVLADILAELRTAKAGRR